MSNIIVIIFDDTEQAGEARASLRELEKGGYLKLDDAAVLVKDESGKIQVKNEVDRSVKVGALGGGLLGLLIAGVFFPLAGIVLGAAAGALIGKSFDPGVEKNFVKEVKDALTPGSSALFVLVSSSNPDMAIAAMRKYEGKVYQTSLDPEAEKTLQEALKG
ncbi:MAG: DUF1269 domain-containing protein [Anaerolineales bacterium]|jgi:uncharacterized membrane protein